MRARRLLAGMTFALLVLAGTVATNITRAERSTAACACVSVNEVLAGHLCTLDNLVREYASGHGGLFPTYDELAAMAPAEYGRYLTSRVDLATGTFTFAPGRDDAGTAGYAVSADRRQYLLLGIGLTVKYRDTYLFGYRVDRETVGFEFPILRPGDTPPEPSPRG